MDFKKAFLSIIPGGLDPMGLIAASVKANVTIVTAFQLFRVLIVSIFIVPGLKYLTWSRDAIYVVNQFHVKETCTSTMDGITSAFPSRIPFGFPCKT